MMYSDQDPPSQPPIPQLKLDRRVNIERIDLEGDYHLIPTQPDDQRDHHDNVDCWCTPQIVFACGLTNTRRWMHIRSS